MSDLQEHRERFAAEPIGIWLAAMALLVRDRIQPGKARKALTEAQLRLLYCVIDDLRACEESEPYFCVDSQAHARKAL